MKCLRHKVYASSSCLQISSQIVAVYNLYSFPKEVEGLLSHTCHYLSGTWAPSDFGIGAWEGSQNQSSMDIKGWLQIRNFQYTNPQVKKQSFIRILGIPLGSMLSFPRNNYHPDFCDNNVFVFFLFFYSIFCNHHAIKLMFFSWYTVLGI